MRGRTDACKRKIRRKTASAVQGEIRQLYACLIALSTVAGHGILQNYNTCIAVQHFRGSYNPNDMQDSCKPSYTATVPNSLITQSSALDVTRSS